MAPEKKKIQLLGKGLNYNGWTPIEEIITGQDYECFVFDSHDELSEDCDLGVLLGYDRIIPESVIASARCGFVLFHSSDLPEGRGWAAIYNTMIGKSQLTQTMLFAAPKVDSGDVLMKAFYPLSGYETENEIRKIDDALTIAMFEKAFEELLTGKVTGTPQDESKATYNKRRTPADSAIDPDLPLRDFVDHLRALPKEAPAFFDYKGRRFNLLLEPAEPGPQLDNSKLTVERLYSLSR